jgi:hypothetical protein
LYPSKTTPITVAAGDTVCVVVQQTIPGTAQIGDRYATTVNAHANDLASVPAAITDLSISDTPPAYSTFISSSDDNTPANPNPAPAVACADVQPAGGTGPVHWDFNGALPPGGTGQVLFQVRVG